ncbi:MAG: DUF6270 domain-containing protein, partial [Clostridia bacterium]|nr:DUF6270 domain-containing protein [Clostridia bacterium]
PRPPQPPPTPTPPPPPPPPPAPNKHSRGPPPYTSLQEEKAELGKLRAIYERTIEERYQINFISLIKKCNKIEIESRANRSYIKDKNIGSKHTVDIWGACISRDIFNYGNDLTVGKYILQNPPHTLKGKPYFVDENKIEAGSDFVRRMTKLALYKQAINYYEDNFKSEYIMIDGANCGCAVSVINNDPNFVFARTPTIDKVLLYLQQKDNIQFKTVSPYDISDNDWYNYMKNFCGLLLEKYSENHIILNKFKHSRYYIKSDGEIAEFKNWSNKANDFSEKINKIICDILPNCLVLEPCRFYLSDPEHRFGFSTLHYIDEVYKIQYNKLVELIK